MRLAAITTCLCRHVTTYSQNIMSWITTDCEKKGTWWMSCEHRQTRSYYTGKLSNRERKKNQKISRVKRRTVHQGACRNHEMKKDLQRSLTERASPEGTKVATVPISGSNVPRPEETVVGTQAFRYSRTTNWIYARIYFYTTLSLRSILFYILLTWHATSRSIYSARLPAEVWRQTFRYFCSWMQRQGVPNMSGENVAATSTSV